MHYYQFTIKFSFNKRTQELSCGAATIAAAARPLGAPPAPSQQMVANFRNRFGLRSKLGRVVRVSSRPKRSI
jgi:hypothetical protein